MKKEKREHISFSQINCFSCPYKYKMIYIDKAIKKENQFMTLGRYVHLAISIYTKDCIAHKVDSDFDLMESAIKKASLEEKLADDQLIEAREILLNFAERNIDFDKIIDQEKEFTLELLDGGLVNGIIDKVISYQDQSGNRILGIQDYKNYFRNPTQTEVDNSLQLRIYRWAALTELYKNFDYVQLAIYNTRFNYMSYGKLEPVAELGNEIESIGNFLNQKYKDIKTAKEFTCIKSDACFEYGNCPVMLQGLCPAYSKDEVERMVNSEDIKELVFAIKQMEAKLKDAKAKLKARMKDSAPIEIDGNTVGFMPSFSYKYLLEALLYLKEKYFIEISKIDVSKTTVESLLKKKYKKPEYEGLLKEIEKYQIPTSRNTFEI
jgi:hypothetical protein